MGHAGAFPGVVKEQLPGFGMFYHVVDLVKIVTNNLFRITPCSLDSPGASIGAIGVEIDPLGIPAPPFHLVVSSMEGYLSDLPALHGKHEHVSITELPGRKGDPPSVGGDPGMRFIARHGSQTRSLAGGQIRFPEVAFVTKHYCLAIR